MRTLSLSRIAYSTTREPFRKVPFVLRSSRIAELAARCT